jgi:hypothetical protein
MKKRIHLFKIATALQLIHCAACLTVIICMPLYGAFYTTVFGKICLTIGQILTVSSTLLPVGLVGTIISNIAYSYEGFKQSPKATLWVAASPLLILILWLAAVSFLVSYTGGV